MKLTKKFALVLAAILVMMAVLTGCGGAEKASTEGLTIGVLKGPTALGAVKIIDNKDAYAGVEIIAAPEDMSAKFIKGEVDIAAVPTNLAGVLYNRTEGKAKVIAINTLGVLYILSSDENVKTMEDLRGKTIVTSGKGSAPEYILNDLLNKNGLTPGEDVTVDYRSEHSEVASLAVAGKADVIMVPEPFVTSITAKSEAMKVAVNMTEAWKAVNGDVPLVMGCLIAGADVEDAVIDAFLTEYEASIKFANESIDETAAIIGEAGIMDAGVVKKALPRCNIVYLDGAEMKSAMETFLTALHEANPKSVGGKLPGADFYYGAE
ncbi:MAG: ABC transporter substrate-binding protein [Clostridiales bacterium]|nr:ABC transporter substrate-binding protein [Clostridiales bacterium]